MNPYWLAFAAALKLYSVHAQNQKVQQLKRQRTDAVRRSREESANILEESLKKAREGRKVLTPESIAKTQNLKSKRLGEVLSKVPTAEYAVADPTLTEKPPIIAGATKAADARALRGIQGYGRNLGDLTAALGSMDTAKQQLARQDTNYALNEKARQQRVLAALLARKLAGLQDTYSVKADTADKAASLAAIYGGGIG